MNIIVYDIYVYIIYKMKKSIQMLMIKLLSYFIIKKYKNIYRMIQYDKINYLYKMIKITLRL